MHELKQAVTEQIKLAIEEEWYTDIEDGLHEIVDGFIPVYYSELADMLASDNSLAYPEDYCGEPDVWGMIQWAIYEQLLSHAYEQLETIREV